MKHSVAIVTRASQGIERSTAIRSARDSSAVVYWTPAFRYLLESSRLALGSVARHRFS
jgi:hypothetical protein